MGRWPGKAGGEVSGGDNGRRGGMRLWQYRHIQAGTECRAHAAGRTQRATKRLGQGWQAFIGGVGRRGGDGGGGCESRIIYWVYAFPWPHIQFRLYVRF
jgi:hypothetical protein